MKNTFHAIRFAQIHILVLFVLFFLSCQKELSDENGSIQSIGNNDLTTKVMSSVSGFITDENNSPAIGALIEFGGSVITTDKYGYFEINEKMVVQNAAVVKISMTGYFTSVRTFITEKNKGSFLRIKLIPKTIAGTINAATGGSVSVAGSLTITIPANAVVVEATGSNYNGSVNVAAFWIDPTSDEIHKLMPGDLRGLDSSGNIKQLTTYGMAIVELTGAAGEKLQIANGKNATLNSQIPLAIQNYAPQTIPLWYFDEEKGLWKEEGNAVKTGNSYIGQVSHFSAWNYDTPANSVIISGTLSSLKGIPVRQALIKISSVSNPNSFSKVYSDATGYFRVAVAQNTQLKLEILGENNCSTPFYSRLITTTTLPVSLGLVTLNLTNNIAYVSGTAIDCSNNPVSKGYVIMFKDGLLYRFNLSSAGTFSFTTILCNNAATINLIAENSTTQQQGSASIFSLNNGENLLGNLLACGLPTNEFVHYSIDGLPAAFDAPADTVWNPVSTYFTVVGRRNLPTFQFANASFDTIGIRLGSLQKLIGFTETTVPGPLTVPSPVFVQITEYGNIGQFVSGNFSGNVRNVNPPNQVYNIVCSFRVRRTL